VVSCFRGCSSLALNHRGRSTIIIAALLLAGSCTSPAQPDVPVGAIRVTGTVNHYTFEGGFWAVRGDDGVTYDPLSGLPPEFQREGLRVVMVAKVRHDLGGIHMVGPIVEILEIHPL
jgi:hypothetical protein